jgi:hypothetical protein
MGPAQDLRSKYWRAATGYRKQKRDAADAASRFATRFDLPNYREAMLNVLLSETPMPRASVPSREPQEAQSDPFRAHTGLLHRACARK